MINKIVIESTGYRSHRAPAKLLSVFCNLRSWRKTWFHNLHGFPTDYLDTRIRRLAANGGSDYGRPVRHVTSTKTRHHEPPLSDVGRKNHGIHGRQEPRCPLRQGGEVNDKHFVISSFSGIFWFPTSFSRSRRSISIPPLQPGQPKSDPP